jgi:cytoskeletal protein RodZ
MLPGLRFLFAAIVLSISMLVFGLGAAALLRAAHEEFASIPSRRAPPETMFAQRGQAQPTLALVRIEAPEADQKTATQTASDNVEDQPAIDLVPAEPEKAAAEPDKIAALTDAAMPLENSPSSDAPNPEASTSEIPVQAETPAQADTPSPAAETKRAAIAEVTAEPDRATVTAPDQAATFIDDSTRIAETRIATLGGPPVTIEPRTPSKRAPALVKKPVQAGHVVKRRRIVQRARVARPAPPPPANPFGTPFGS